MSFYPQKCKVLHITRSRQPTKAKYHIRGTALESVSQAAYLGVELDDKLTWTPHINQVTSKATRTLNFVRRNVRVASKAVKETAYQSLVRPSLDYASTVWGPHTITQTRQVEMVQRRAARYVCNRYHNTSSVTDMLHDLDWESLEHRRRKFRLCMAYKIINQLVAIPSCQYFQPAQPRPSHNHPLTFIQQHASTQYYRFSFFIRVVPEWNSLPATIAMAPSLDTFKARLHRHAVPAAL